MTDCGNVVLPNQLWSCVDVHISREATVFGPADIRVSIGPSFKNEINAALRDSIGARKNPSYFAQGCENNALAHGIEKQDCTKTVND